MERINPTEYRVGRKNQKGMETLGERQREEDLQCWREDKKLGCGGQYNPKKGGKNEASGDRIKRKIGKKRKNRKKLYRQIPATQSMPL